MPDNNPPADLVASSLPLDCNLALLPSSPPHPQHCNTTSPAFFYRHTRWSADGTTLISSTSNNTITAHVIPSDLLSSRSPSLLVPHGTLRLPSPSAVFEPAPYFSLNDPATQIVLTATKDAPVQIFHLFPNGQSLPAVAGYKLIRHETEAYIHPLSAIWASPGTHFLLGSTNRIDYLDASRPGTAEPLLTIHTIPSRRHLSKGGGVGMKGGVAAMDLATDEYAPVLAAGTRTRWISLYDIGRSSQATGTWSVRDVAKSEFGIDTGGSGIMQVKWSPCNRYLIVNERQSSGMLVYDIRGTRRPLCILPRTKDLTNQRVTCDVYQNKYGGFEVWAGDQNGVVSVWEDISAQEGVIEASWSWQVHDCAVGSTSMHMLGSVVATCGGSWDVVSDESLEQSLSVGEKPTELVGSSALRIWDIGGNVGLNDEVLKDAEQE
ncbi:hypothetical protein TD95_004161 [Thielaviopsis punctulata]|uniref:Uncharacterized protein n=1 Tax=Thielaviopsis punctulata TaxID=72032 RepID=A0A0F4ZFI6_9PEZI|nr:hypothetical protein TD95_004161 [Thielaviopsis punctulata]